MKKRISNRKSNSHLYRDASIFIQLVASSFKAYFKWACIVRKNKYFLKYSSYFNRLDQGQ
jgi:hypothetical protein